MKLLIAVDSTISTDVLVGAVGVRPWPDGTTAHVLSVVADTDVPEELWREQGYGKRAVLREMERRGEQISALSVERLREIGIPGEVVVSRGRRPLSHPVFCAEMIFGPDLRPRTVRKDYAHWMLGSVARAVVASAPCTVQIVRDAGEDHAQTLDSGRRVLLATDGSKTSVQAARAVAGRPWPEGSEFRVISVEEPWTIKSSRVRHEKEAQEAVSSAEQMLASAGLKATGAVLSGNTKQAILQEAQKWAAELIVVGSHGRRGFKRFLLGSVSEAVAMNAHCSVVVVRAPRKTET